MSVSSTTPFDARRCRGISAQTDSRWAPKSTAIWFEPAWLGADLEHRRDQTMLHALLDDMARTEGLDRFTQLLDAAVNLLRSHVALEPSLHAARRLRAATAHLLTLIEQLERTAPDNPLYLSQAAAFRFGVDLLLALENELLQQTRHVMAARPQRALLRARSRVLNDAAALLRQRKAA